MSIISYSMKTILQKIHQNIYFLLFILIFAYIQSIYIRIAVRRMVNAYTFTPEAALASLMGAGILFFIIRYFIRIWQPDTKFSIGETVKIFGFSLVSYVASMQLIGMVIAIVFGKVEQNFSQQAFVLSLFSDFLDGLIYGSFFLAYYYYNANKEYQQQVASYNKAISEAKINQLKTQLNPHFLFNNLNILDQLIEEDKFKASDFLNEFADIYRYVLLVSDKELVKVEEEVGFIKQYFRLLQHKYGDIYQLHIDNVNEEGYTVPLSIQLLIENAVKHNLGTLDNPIVINVVINENITVSNNIILKRKTRSESGMGLKNLIEQYRLLTAGGISIQEYKTVFKVTVPIISKHK